MTQVVSSHKTSQPIPFALLRHQSAVVDDEKLLGIPKQEWSWQPLGDLKPEDLGVYASTGMSTTRQTGAGQWDHGEFY
jgi:hypothetical protein